MAESLLMYDKNQPQLVFQDLCIGGQCDVCNLKADFFFVLKKDALANSSNLRCYRLCAGCTKVYIRPIYVEEGDLSDTLKKMFPDYVIDW